jgi:hypothetical protein
MLDRAFVTGEVEDKATPPEAKVYGDQADPSALLTDAPEVVGPQIVQMWVDQDPFWQRHRAECLAAAYRREGRTDVVVDKRENISEWKVSSWGTVDPCFNYAAKLCRHLPAMLYGDPPQPRVEAEDTETHDETTAAFTQRVLRDLNADTNLDGTNLCRSAFDLASTYKSAFVWSYVVPQGTRQAMQIDAHPQAVHAEQPFSGPPDPMTGQPTPLNPDEAASRYVMPDGALTDDKDQAALQWVPALREQALTSLQVRPVPATAPDLWHADGALMALFLPKRQWKAMFPDMFTEMSAEDEGKLTARPNGTVKYLLHHLEPKEQTRLLNQTGDDALILGVLYWCEESPIHEQGFYGVALGSGLLAYRGPWANPQTGRGLRVPLSQIMQYREGTRTFYGGAGAMDILGPMQEAFALTVQYEFETMDRNAHRKTFVPLGSNVTPEEYEDPNQRLLSMGPQGQPFQEELESLDPTIQVLAQMALEQMKDAIGLTDVAQGGDSPNITSGRQLFGAIGQAQSALSEVRQHRDRFETRRWQNQLEQIGAFYTVPQLMQYAGEDGEQVAKRWTGEDVRHTRTVRIRPGTGTLLTPQQKVEQALALAANPATGITPSMVQAVVANGMSLEMGFPDDPQRQRVTRQIAKWEQGPPDGWQPVPPQPQVMGVGPDGQPVTQMVPVPDPVALAIFDPRLSDDFPTVALLRTQMLADAMAGTAFDRQPPAWQQVLTAELDRARRAAGVATVQEQQQAQAAQVAQQQQHEAQMNPPKTDPNQKPAQEALQAAQAAV